MSEIFAAQITAVANVVLATFAIVTAVLALLAWRKQSKEVSDQAKMLELQRKQLADQEKTSADQAEVLKLQAQELRESLDERKREAEERLRDQASQVYMWEEHQLHAEIGKTLEEVIVAHVHNTSPQPVYKVRFEWHNGDGPHTLTRRAAPLKPDEPDSDRFIVPQDADGERFSAVVIFRDRAGLWWRARPDGQIDAVPLGSEPPDDW